MSLMGIGLLKSHFVKLLMFSIVGASIGDVLKDVLAVSLSQGLLTQ